MLEDGSIAEQGKPHAADGAGRALRRDVRIAGSELPVMLIHQNTRKPYPSTRTVRTLTLLRLARARAGRSPRDLHHAGVSTLLQSSVTDACPRCAALHGIPSRRRRWTMPTADGSWKITGWSDGRKESDIGDASRLSASIARSCEGAAYFRCPTSSLKLTSARHSISSPKTSFVAFLRLPGDP